MTHVPSPADSDSCGPAARARVQRELAEYAAVETVRDALSPGWWEAPPDVDTAWAATRARWTEESSGLGRASSRRVRETGSRTRMLRASAFGVAALLLAGIGTRLMHHGSADQSRVAHTYRTQLGQQATIQLSDGSRVTLAPATTIHVVADTVSVDGAAYFTITPRSNRPFIVQTTNAFVQVLGTKFTVRRYATDRSSRIVVEDGRVALRARHALSAAVRQPHASEAPAVLTARMAAHVTDSAIIVTSGIAIGDAMGWIDGRLVFDGTPLRDVVTELSRAYGATIRVTDSALAEKTMTIKASVKAQPLSQVLELISLAAEAEVTRAGDAFVLIPRRNAGSMTPNYKRFPQPEKQYGR